MYLPRSILLFFAMFCVSSCPPKCPSFVRCFYQSFLWHGASVVAPIWQQLFEGTPLALHRPSPCWVPFPEFYMRFLEKANQPRVHSRRVLPMLTLSQFAKCAPVGVYRSLTASQQAHRFAHCRFLFSASSRMRSSQYAQPSGKPARCSGRINPMALWRNTRRVTPPSALKRYCR